MTDPQIKKPLSLYVAAVIVVWAVILGAMWFFDPAHFHGLAIFCGGFLLGMLAMYIAVHVYRWK